MEIRVEAWIDDPCRLAIYFREKKFALLYPQQRWHYLHHLIPAEFQDRYLSSSVWFELAPGELPSDLVYSDGELVANIREPIMRILNTTSFFATLDEMFMRPENPAACWATFALRSRYSQPKGSSSPSTLTSSVFSWRKAVTATVRSSTTSPKAASSLGATGRTGKAHPSRSKRCLIQRCCGSEVDLQKGIQVWPPKAVSVGTTLFGG